MPAPSTSDERRSAVANGLLPPIRIADRPLRWTMDERLAAYGCPGAAVAAMRDGSIDWVDGFGRRRAGGADAVGPDTVFMVASCSKPVTAVLVLQQVERGVFDLDVPVNRYLRRWQIPENDFTRDTPVTLRRMLSHTAGLTVNGWGGVRNDGSPVPTVTDLLEGTELSGEAAVRVDKAHDGQSRYSGAGFLLSLMALEDTLGRPFADLADEMLFTPLGMSRSSFEQHPPQRLRDDLAAGHGADGQPLPGDWLIPREAGAGGMFSTARDYATFLLACRAAWLGEPGAVLGQSLAREMFTRQFDGVFGLGIRVLGDGASRRGNHGGSNDGYQSETNLFLESGDGAVVLTNAVSGIYLYREILNGVAEVYDWPDFLLPPKRLAVLSDGDRQAFVGRYRIVSGIELPHIDVWVRDGELVSEIAGLRFGVQPVMCDDQGVLFNQTGPFETHTTRGPDGRVHELRVMEAGVAEIMRAVRAD